MSYLKLQIPQYLNLRFHTSICNKYQCHLRVVRNELFDLRSQFDIDTEDLRPDKGFFMIHDSFECASVSPEDMDILWSHGFRHFGTLFFRYDESCNENGCCDVVPLRINLEKFKLSQSQKRILRRNSDLEVKVREAFIDDDRQRLFDAHKLRFRDNIPDSLYSFLSFDPSSVPCRAIEFDLYNCDALIGVGYLDIGKTATSSVCTFFDLSYGRRSLGIYMLLVEIIYSMENRKSYLYPGYAYKQPSFYDYKKKFHGLESFDWRKEWHPMERAPSSQIRTSY